MFFWKISCHFNDELMSERVVVKLKTVKKSADSWEDSDSDEEVPHCVFRKMRTLLPFVFAS